jgi:type III secretion protein T
MSITELNLLGPALWLSLALCMARWLGLSLMLPLLGRRHMGAVQLNAICLALALPQVPGVFDHLAAGQWQGPWLVLLGIKEVLLGVLLGALLSIPFWVLRGGLTLVDNQRGANAAQMNNPSMEADTSILGELGERMLIVWLVEAGAFVLLFDLMADSLLIWPVLDLAPLSMIGDGTRLWQAFAGLMSKTLLFAAPALFVLLMVEFAMALASSSVKGIDVYQISMPIKSLAVLILIATAGYAWFARGVEDLQDWWREGVFWALGA